jgi:hypothetical protein
MTSLETSGRLSPEDWVAGTFAARQDGQQRQEPLLCEAAEGDAAGEPAGCGGAVEGAEGGEAEPALQNHRGPRGKIQKEPALHHRHLHIRLQYPSPHEALKNKILLFAYDAPDAKEPDRSTFEQLIR